MKKLVAALVVLAMILAMVPAVFAADATSGTVEIESYGNGEFTAPSDGTVKLTLDVDANIDVVIGYSLYASVSSGETIDVTAGTTYYVYPVNVTVDCTLTWEYVDGEEDSGSDEEEVTYDVMIPSGNRVSNDYTWIADKTGTLTIGVSTLYQYAIVDYETGEGVWEDAGAMADMAFIRGGLNYVVNGEIFSYSPTVTLDVAAGDNVTVGLHHYMGNQYAADLTFSVEESSGDEGGETTPDGSSEAPYVIESIPYTIEQSGEHDVYYVWTPDVDGTILISRPTGNYVSSLPNYEEVGDYYLVEVVAGEQITLNPWGSNSGSYTIDWYNGEDLEVEPDGSPNAPYVIDAIPYTATYAADNYGYDEYYVWTADKSGTLTVTYPAGGVVGISGAEWEKDEENLTYTVEAEQGAEIVFNFWTSLSAGGDYVIAWAEDDGGEEIAPNDCDVVLPGEVISSGKDFMYSNDDKKEYYQFSWTAPADGIVHIHMCEANPGWAYSADGLTYQHSGTEATTDTYTVLAGTTYDFTVKAYNTAVYTEGDGEVAWIISFEAGEVEVEKEDYIIIDDIITDEGTYEIGMEYADVTIVTFAPSVEGIYTVTVNGQAVIGNYGGGSWYIYPSESVNHGTSLEWICADAPEVETDTILDENWQEIEIERINDGQGLMIGIKPDSEDVESVEITIEKTGEYVEEEIELEIYVNQAELNQFELGDLVVGDYVDVYGEDHTAVLGEDGYYHLDSADGPILLVDMDYLAVLTDALSDGRGIMYAYVVDENGEITAKYDIADAVKAYEAVCDENGYYPLTEDLMFFYQVYAVGNGVPDYVLEEGFNVQCSWMFACITADYPTSEEGKPGDTALAAVIGLMAVSAMGITVVVSKKKEF